MFDIKLLGRRIKELRLKSGLTQNAFAEELRVSFQAVSNWERGVTPPDLDNLILIAERFGVLIDDLVRGVECDCVLGIDGGGTKTEFAVTTVDGKVLKRFLRERSNPNDIGFDAAYSVIDSGIRDALTEFPSLRGVFAGMSGVTASNYRARILSQLQNRYSALKFDVQNDSANLFAMDDRAEMSLISGTGSVVFVKKEDGYVRLGGWGYLFDRAGSAYDIGRDAVATALAEEDALEPYSALSRALLKRLGAESAWGAIGSIYDKGKPYIASLAEVVFDAYKAGDPKAIGIVDRNARRLGELLELGIERYGARPRAIASGGVFEGYSDILLSHLSRYTDAEIVIADLPQVYGACRRARMLLDGECAAEFYTNFKNSYEGENDGKYT